MQTATHFSFVTKTGKRVACLVKPEKDPSSGHSETVKNIRFLYFQKGIKWLKLSLSLSHIFSYDSRRSPD